MGAAHRSSCAYGSQRESQTENRAGLGLSNRRGFFQAESVFLDRALDSPVQSPDFVAPTVPQHAQGIHRAGMPGLQVVTRVLARKPSAQFAGLAVDSGCCRTTSW